MKFSTDLTREWRDILSQFLATDKAASLERFVNNEIVATKVFPESKDMFKAFTESNFSYLRVVILGQDPYHDDNQAHGLCFSVKDGTKLPPSLKNIYKEIESDLGTKKDFDNGNLVTWANQGVFLLNTVLSVQAHIPGSHSGIGWEDFTDEVIKVISEKREHVVFMLWGNFALSKKSLIDTKKHLILEASHPSPLSAYRGFFGCKHFSACNRYLQKHRLEEIRW